LAPKQANGKGFELLLLEALDDALGSLGEDVRTAVYFHLEEKFRLKRCEIPFRLEDFQAALERVFGLGARHLEILFMKHLHAKLGVVLEWPTVDWVIPEMTFKEYVQLMKQTYESERAGQTPEVLVDVNAPQQAKTVEGKRYS